MPQNIAPLLNKQKNSHKITNKSVNQQKETSIKSICKTKKMKINNNKLINNNQINYNNSACPTVNDENASPKEDIININTEVNVKDNIYENKMILMNNK